MAVLKIHSDIVDEETRQMNLSWFGIDGTSFDSVDAFVDSISEGDNTIELRINCRGGECMEGWAIYDKLRSTGKEITAIIEGKCASMASVLLLAAPLERRFAYQNSSLLIHNPYIPPYTLADAYDADSLRAIANDLESETTRLVNLYVDRTGSDENTLRALMNEDKFINMEQAKELGFISEIKPPLSAKQINNQRWSHFNTNNMSKEKKVTVAQAFEMLGIALGIKQGKIVNMELSTADGSVLNVEREEGEPQVGDAASPDGEHLMPDGKTIVVTDGVITEIKEPANSELEEAKARIQELEDEIATLRPQAKTAKDLEVLNVVAQMGGIEGLKKISSTYIPKARTGMTGKVDQFANATEPESYTEKLLKEKREAKKQKYNKK